MYFVLCSFSDSADKLNKKVSKGLFMFAVSNSCMNPIVYGKSEMTKLQHNSYITRESKDFQFQIPASHLC